MTLICGRPDCGEHLVIDAVDADAVQAVMRRHGWTHVDGVDYCPREGHGPCLVCGAPGTHRFTVVGGPVGSLCEMHKNALMTIDEVTYGETGRR
jgi:hypothetical protein